MKKTKIRIFTTLLMTVPCLNVLTTTTFASGGKNVEDEYEPTPEEQGDTAEESENKTK